MSRWTLLAAALLLTCVPLVAFADEEFPPPPPPPPPNAGALYLIVATGPDGTFSLSRDSSCLVVNLGYVVGGVDALDASAVLSAVAPFTLPGGFSFADLDGNQATVLGSYSVPPPSPKLPDDPHVVTPNPDDPTTEDDDIPFDVQQGIFIASTSFVIDALGHFTSTLEVVDAIHGVMPPEPDRTDAIYSAVFTTDRVFSAAQGILTTEGELFPHDPGAALFTFAVDLTANDDGELSVTADVCRIVDVDVKPNASPNLLKISTKKGAMKVAFLTDDRFDAADVDPTTAEIDGVPAVGSKMQDVDHDGDDDLVLKFKVKDLVEAGVVDDHTTEVTVRADLEDGTCVLGTDAVEPSDDVDEESN